MSIYDKQYNQVAKNYRQFSISNKELIYVTDPLLMELIGDLNGKDVLDIGCGNGYHLSIVKEKNPKTLMGTDISESQIELCKEYLPRDIDLMVGSADAENFIEDLQSINTKQFDVIYHSYVQVHMSNSERMKSLWTNIYKLLKNEGKAVAIVSDPKAAKASNVEKLLDLEYEFVNGAPLQNGDVYQTSLGPELKVYSYYWTSETVAKIIQNIGFKNVEKVSVHANDISERVYSNEEWDKIEKSGAVYALLATK